MFSFFWFCIIQRQYSKYETVRDFVKLVKCNSQKVCVLKPIILNKMYFINELTGKKRKKITTAFPLEDDFLRLNYNE